MISTQCNPHLYQVFLCTSPANIFACYVAHTWIVTNERGVLARWEIFHIKDRAPGIEASASDTYHTWGHLHRDYHTPFVGIDIFPWSDHHRWKGTVLGVVEGDETSLAAKMVNCIKNSPHAYPYHNHYGLLGPNCNTYTQWILNQFPTCDIRLPINALGKDLARRMPMKN